MGSCVIDANQAGEINYSAAPEVEQTIAVGAAPRATDTISLTAPASGTVGGSATLWATGGASGNPVVFSVDGTYEHAGRSQDVADHPEDIPGLSGCRQTASVLVRGSRS